MQSSSAVILSSLNGERYLEELFNTEKGPSERLGNAIVTPVCRELSIFDTYHRVVLNGLCGKISSTFHLDGPIIERSKYMGIEPFFYNIALLVEFCLRRSLYFVQ